MTDEEFRAMGVDPAEARKGAVEGLTDPRRKLCLEITPDQFAAMTLEAQLAWLARIPVTHPLHVAARLVAQARSKRS